MKLLALREAVRLRIGTTTGDRMQDDVAIDNAVNLAVDQLEAEYRWPWMERVEEWEQPANLRAVELDSKYRATRSLARWTGQEWDELAQVAPIDALRSVGQGPANRYALHGRQIILAPVCARAQRFQHLFYAGSPYLDNDDAVPYVPDEFSDAIVVAAAAKLAAREGDRGSQGAFTGEYEAWVKRMRIALRTHTGPIVPRVRSGGWSA